MIKAKREYWKIPIRFIRIQFLIPAAHAALERLVCEKNWIRACFTNPNYVTTGPYKKRI